MGNERDWAQRALDTAEVILLALDLQGRIVQVNRYACSLLGWTADELVGRDWIETCLPARIRPPLRQRFTAVLEGDPSILENPVLTRSGEERLIEWRNTVLRDDAGQVIGTFSSGTDITERNRVEAQLRLQSAALSATAHAMVITDRAGVIEWVNPAFSALTGYTAAEAVGRNPRDLVKSDQHDPAFYRHIWDTILAGHVWRGEIVNRRKDGSLYTEDQTITPVRDSRNEIAHFVAVKQDITERKRNGEALRAAEERTRFALQNAGVGIWDLDYTTGALQWSETLEAHFGLRPGTFGGTFEAFVERIHPDDRASVLETVGAAMKTGADFSTSHRSIWPDGTVRWLSGTGRILLGTHGEPVRGVGISMDVTERRTLEEQFHHSQKMEAVGRLAGGVAHDFNNLLTAILGYCELLLADAGVRAQHRPDLIEIQKAGTRAAALTRQLLAFSRKQIIEPTLLDLNVIVADIRGMLERLIGEDIEVAISLRPEFALVEADRSQVDQVIMNLAVNARDAMPKGGRLTIETDSVELDEHNAMMHGAVTPGSYVTLTVTDTGMGISPQVRARLFEPFFTTKETGKGTGLGLATVYGIVTRNGGTVQIDSEVGRGTSCKVYLPRAEAAEPVPADALPAGPPTTGTHTVLVVEDEDALRTLAKRLLERQGYVVLVAASADEALRLVDQHASIDVLLTDVVMPGASGPELTRALVDRRPGLKVIFMSGYPEDAMVHHGVLKPEVAFIQKPFTSDALGRKVREVLSSRS